MPEYRFRLNMDVVIDADSEEAARELLDDKCEQHGSPALSSALRAGRCSCIGLNELQPITAEEQHRVRGLEQPGFQLMSCRYRDENFTMITRNEELSNGQISIVPVALVLTEAKVEHLTDPFGHHVVEIQDEEPQ